MNSHLGGAYEQGDSNTIMPDVWGYLLVKFGLKSVLDIGCGYGHAMEWFAGFNVHVVGIEGDPEAVRKNKMPNNVVEHDFTLGPVKLEEKFHLAHNFDLAWCAEFLEHVEAQFIPNIMQAFRLCQYAIITHGEPGQDGYHHVNCQDSHYWVKAFHEWGFSHVCEETNLLRATDRWKAGWGRRTLMFFRRNWPVE